MKKKPRQRAKSEPVLGERSARAAAVVRDRERTPRSEWLEKNRRAMRITASAIGLFALIIYVLTLWPSVPGGDSGELISVAHALGIAHPPGYPLFTLLAKLFTFIPHGSIAWRVNFLSALCDASAALLLCLAVCRWSRSLPAGILAGGLFAFSPLIWTWAIQAEVFALNNLFVTALLYSAILYRDARSPRLVITAAFLFGLGLTNHQTLLFVGAPIGVWMLALSRRELFNPLGLLKVFGAFFVGLSVYIYLPLAALHHPTQQWGDPTTLDGFLTHILRKEYGTLQLGANQERPQFFNGLGLFFFWLPGEMLFLGPLLGAFGFYKALRSRADDGLGKLFCFAFAAYLVVFNALANLPIQERLNFGIFTRFWQEAYIFVFAWIGLGFAALIEFIYIKYIENKSRSIGLEMMSKAALALSIALVLVQMGVHYPSQDQHRNHIFQQFGESLLGALPANAILLTRGDVYTNTTSYLQECEGMRPDVICLDREVLKTNWRRPQIERRFPSVKLPRGVYEFKKDDRDYNLGDLIRANIDKHPMFICNMDPDEDQSWQGELLSWPFGLINEVVKNDGSFNAEKYVAESANVLSAFDIKALPPVDKLFAWDFYIWSEYWEADHRKGRRLLTYAIDHGNDPVLLRDAANLMEALVEKHPAPPPLLFKNLGYAYSRLSITDPSAAQGEKKAWAKYLELVSGETQNPDPDLPVIKKAIDAIPRASTPAPVK